MNYLKLKPSYRVGLITSLVFVATFALATGPAHAAPQEITITPTSIDQVIQPGTTFKGALQVLDQGESSYSFQVYSAPYHVDGEDYTPDFTVLPSAPNVKSWFTFSSTGGQLSPGQTANIGYSINMPANTPPGGYYAAVFAQTQPPKQTGRILLNERVGEIFYLEAAGPVTKQGKVLSWTSSLLQDPPLAAALRLENTGGVHYPATIQVNVRDIFGHSKYSLKTVKEVLPQTIRRVPVSWSKAPAIGLFKVTGNVSFLSQHQTLPTKWVLVMSQKVRLGLAGLLVLIVILVVLRSFYRRRASRKPTYHA